VVVKKILFAVLLFSFLFFGATICSYEGPDTSSDLMKLTDFSVVGKKPVYVGQGVDVYFKIQNIDKLPKSLGKYGINVRARTPDGKIETLRYDYSYKEIGSLETLEFDKSIKFDEPGIWVVWPSYYIAPQVGGQGYYGPDYWHSCNIEVERECEKGCECLTESEAKKKFGKYEKCSEEICGYVYVQGEPEEEKYCFRAPLKDSDNDGIPDKEDKCVDAPETFNKYMDDDGCPDEVPKKCQEGMVCITPEVGEKSGYFIYLDNNQPIVCDYLDYKTPMYCYKPPEKPDLTVMDVWLNGSYVHYKVKNIGGGEAGESNVSLYINQAMKEEARVGGLGAGEEKEGRFSEPARCLESSITIKVVVDSRREVSETNENNNELQRVFECQRPDLIITDVWVENVSCGIYSIKYKIKNQGNLQAGRSRTKLYINGEFFGEDEVGELGPGEEKGVRFSRTWNPDRSKNNITAVADGDNAVDEGGMEGNNRKEKEAEIVLQCCPPCVCLPNYPNPIEIGYRYCRDVEMECGPSATFGSLKITPMCYILETVFEDYFCSPPITNFGYGESFSFSADFTKWDGFVAGDVLGDERDEIIVVQDDGGGNIRIYAWNGTLLMNAPIRYTPYDRVAVGDVYGDEKEEIIVAVDEDAPGDNGRIYVYQITGSPGNYSLRLVIGFDEWFTHYDALLVGKLYESRKNQLVIASDDSDALYIYDFSGGSIDKKSASFPVDIHEFRYTHEANDGTHDEIVIADVLKGGHDEIVFLENKNSLEKSVAYTFRYAGEGRPLKLVRKINIPFTKYDGVAAGDVLGDEREELIIGIDEARATYIVDPMFGLVKVHYRKWTKYDGIAVGYFHSISKAQVAVAIDEDDAVYVTFEDELMRMGG